jgi:hypothetical protein
MPQVCRNREEDPMPFDGEDRLAARFLCEVAFIDFSDARDPDTSRQLEAAFARDGGQAVGRPARFR